MARIPRAILEATKTTKRTNDEIDLSMAENWLMRQEIFDILQECIKEKYQTHVRISKMSDSPDCNPVVKCFQCMDSNRILNCFQTITAFNSWITAWDHGNLFNCWTAARSIGDPVYFEIYL